MKKNEIMQVLENSDEPLEIDEIFERTDIPKTRLRLNLFRLQEEGTVEGIQKEGKIRWRKTEKNPKEKRYEDIPENPK
ncbi:MAG: ArsR family transcriptional regulator [Candidatus Hadarchaeota archaeon]